MENNSEAKINLSVEVDTETAKALDYIARFHGCTVEAFLEGYIKAELDKLPDPPYDSHG